MIQIHKNHQEWLVKNQTSLQRNQRIGPKSLNRSFIKIRSCAAVDVCFCAFRCIRVALKCAVLLRHWGSATMVAKTHVWFVIPGHSRGWLKQKWYRKKWIHMNSRYPFQLLQWLEVSFLSKISSGTSWLIWKYEMIVWNDARMMCGVVYFRHKVGQVETPECFIGCVALSSI